MLFSKEVIMRRYPRDVCRVLLAHICEKIEKAACLKVLKVFGCRSNKFSFNLNLGLGVKKKLYKPFVAPAGEIGQIASSDVTRVSVGAEGVERSQFTRPL